MRMEAQFLTHVRTYQFRNFRRRTEPGEIPPARFTKKQFTRALKQHGINSIRFTELIQSGKIEARPIYEKGFPLIEIKTIEPGPVDMRLLKPDGRPLNELTRGMLSYLSMVSIPPELEPPFYFKTFLRLKSSHSRLFFQVDEFAGRVHTPVSSLHRHMRPYLLLKGTPVTSFDVKTMQPLILGKILKYAIGENEFSQWMDGGRDIYHAIMEKTGIKDRDKAKERFFQIAYGLPSNNLANMFGRSQWIDWVNQFK